MSAAVTYERMADADILENAHEILVAVADVATLLGIKRLDRTFGILGGELATLSENLEKLNNTIPEDKLERRTKKLLRDLARACSWHLKTPVTDSRLLFGLIKTSRSHDHSKAAAEAQTGLLAYAAEGRLPKLTALVRGFAGAEGAMQPVQSFVAPVKSPSLASKLIPQNEYPRHVSKQLYQTLCRYSTCQCDENDEIRATTPMRRKAHLSRLRLKPFREVKERFVCFDMVFSSRPVHPFLLREIEWQHMQFQVLSERAGKKRARFSELENCLGLPQQRRILAKEEQLCEHMRSASGSQICLRVRDDQVWLLEDCLPLEASVLSSPSLSLSAALQTGHLSNKMKVILAYIIARSVWEFYNSDWMSRSWSAEDIHFLQESSSDVRGKPVVSINRPYLAFEWTEGQESNNDTSVLVGQIHRYPRILSLGLMLIEIGSGKRAENLFRNYRTNVNSDWLSAKEFLSKPTPWEDFDYRKYWDAARSCVNNQFFLRTNSSSGADSLSDIEGRRRMILDEVVTPLEELLAGTGWIHDIWTLGPMEPSSTQSISARVASLSTPCDQSRRDPTHMTRSFVGDVQRHALLGSTFSSLSISEPDLHGGPTDRLSFKIAIICALPTEADAVISLFDEHWDGRGRSYGKAARDPNAYTPGRIGQHDVVVVHMPSMGKVSAASVAQGLHSSFENIQLALVVGICGGVPYTRHKKREIFLGDVIISRSLIQYDFGRRYDTGFDAKESLQGGLGKSPAEIRSALARLETWHHRRQLEVGTADFLKEVQQKLRGSAYPGAERDIVFTSGSRHSHTAGSCHICSTNSPIQICTDAIERSCEELGCRINGTVQRTRVQNGASLPISHTTDLCSPAVHIGNMGSGDTVMKSATHRDEVAQKHDIIGFEMEGAGIWESFPSIVIKSVCDYADSHKNKEWQTYAAATAAAVTKAFLNEWTG
ncbi:hypothetical protein H2200_002583 [Cladophialophora chaetospira]|uniref:Nucleoside phosphorylase domain-containing protein n=1 Tax=Cladophialophora chaetospira TaxID=386627 RepID=A0AA38XJ58_9EURO|nr:hypothetical protein H2200_002583 [Cladophialophora chaetospira]